MIRRDEEKHTVRPPDNEVRFDFDAYMSYQPPQTFSVQFSETEVQAKRRREFLASPQLNRE